MLHVRWSTWCSERCSKTSLMSSDWKLMQSTRCELRQEKPKPESPAGSACGRSKCMSVCIDAWMCDKRKGTKYKEDLSRVTESYSLCNGGFGMGSHCDVRKQSQSMPGRKEQECIRHNRKIYPRARPLQSCAELRRK